jgi:4-hydroxyphenylacetate 3-monooxygenase/4-hydroxybutyryl-CoA dehydratase/vinylacetyl-CoA-Delta-isomerase
MKTDKDYQNRLYSYKRNIFLQGEKVGRDHPSFQSGINAVSESFRAALDPQVEHLFTTTSHLTGKKVNRFNSFPRSVEDVLKKIECVRTLAQRLGGCALRCGGMDTLSGLSVVTREVDEEFKTDYHSRFLKFLQHMQDNDLVTSILITDPKGDRSLRPHQQVDPDMYLRIVEKKSDGIVVNGAKLFGETTVQDEITVGPTRAMTDKDGDYALSFSVPADYDGVTILCKPVKALKRNKIKAPYAEYGYPGITMTVFDKVFVPWERVWLCGEWKYAGRLSFLIALYHRTSYCGCKAAVTDLILGTAALVAEYNGLEKEKHIREKLAHLAATAEMIYACGVTGAVRAKAASSGTFIPDPIYINAGRYHAGMNIYNEFETLSDISAGQGINLPTEEDFVTPELDPYTKKYIKRKADISAENIWRLFRMVDEMLYSEQAGFWHAAGLHGGGSPIMERLTILANYDMDAKKRLVKRLAGIS